ncbi:hypothetical protein [Streptomyces coffeae]|uniref:Uncharacterized protein n=1 Tax=Streptomyces coffeae TaxID=621382 RepID=A0ABS1NQ96_9ACTN|nr:hypothetical protein [Streptomyces coffeae]MBL1102263.1 hypothetical protein [Streptomyces coffeae]
MMSAFGQHRSPCPRRAARPLLSRVSAAGAPLVLSDATVWGAVDGIEVPTDWINAFG